MRNQGFSSKSTNHTDSPSELLSDSIIDDRQITENYHSSPEDMW
ncbi:MAG: hypothetical protein J07HQW2_01576 [Haloquadratum walsbyi J07HQW2]|uniref:Uncharacterized protein n=1 Tax=Haloquadratum walsbyi J07HQW2 TaxID=1238425 RepID=U1NDQ4_9EURY|nr:MAG: hypothetical protein J07HQW2_01576 [Haloquadratum walsbyi J07HQW2]